MTAGVFVQNMERLELLAFLPIYLVGFGGMIQAVWSQASAKQTGRSMFRDEDSDILSVRNEVATRLDERWFNDTFLTRYRSITKHSKIESELDDAENSIDEALREFLAAQLNIRVLTRAGAVCMTVPVFWPIGVSLHE